VKRKGGGGKGAGSGVGTEGQEGDYQKTHLKTVSHGAVHQKTELVVAVKPRLRRRKYGGMYVCM